MASAGSKSRSSSEQVEVEVLKSEIEVVRLSRSISLCIRDLYYTAMIDIARKVAEEEHNQKDYAACGVAERLVSTRLQKALLEAQTILNEMWANDWLSSRGKSVKAALGILVVNNQVMQDIPVTTTMVHLMVRMLHLTDNPTVISYKLLYPNDKSLRPPSHTLPYSDTDEDMQVLE